jgi:exosortase family protein XrtF
MLREFKPALLFLGKFLAIYFAGNIIYGLFVERYGVRPDPITRWVTVQTGELLTSLGLDAEAVNNTARPTVLLQTEGRTAVSVFEGCNGVNVMIVFAAFLFAFGGPFKSMAWFLPAGILIIHLFNLARIGLLYYSALYRPSYFYYFHKYFFTAILYLVVFALWALWVTKFKMKHVRAGT